MSAIFTDLEGKKILVTGATRGIGRAIVESLAAQKAHIIFNYREGKEAIAKELADQLLEKGASAVNIIEFDVNNTEQMKANLDSLIKEIGGFSGLVNNAGISKDMLASALKMRRLGEFLIRI